MDKVRIAFEDKVKPGLFLGWVPGLRRKSASSVARRWGSLKSPGRNYMSLALPLGSLWELARQTARAD